MAQASYCSAPEYEMTEQNCSDGSNATSAVGCWRGSLPPQRICLYVCIFIAKKRHVARNRDGGLNRALRLNFPEDVKCIGC